MRQTALCRAHTWWSTYRRAFWSHLCSSKTALSPAARTVESSLTFRWVCGDIPPSPTQRRCLRSTRIPKEVMQKINYNDFEGIRLSEEIASPQYFCFELVSVVKNAALAFLNKVNAISLFFLQQWVGWAFLVWAHYILFFHNLLKVQVFEGMQCICLHVSLRAHPWTSWPIASDVVKIDYCRSPSVVNADSFFFCALVSLAWSRWLLFFESSLVQNDRRHFALLSLEEFSILLICRGLLCLRYNAVSPNEGSLLKYFVNQGH